MTARFFSAIKGLLLKILIFTFLMVPIILKAQQTIDIGLVNNNEMETLYHLKWFSKKYIAFTPTVLFNDNLVKDLRQSDFFVFMGDWCHDTKMFLPKFFKLLDSLEIPKERTTLYNVDKRKQRPRVPIKRFGINYLPTVIFIKNDIEVGRIVEFPYLSIEEDILKIYTTQNNKTKE